MKKRIRYIDITRAFAMILIVIGHTLVHSNHCNAIFKLIYSFHIALFFIISGYLHKKDLSFKKYVVNKFNRLMIPYFIWSFIFLIPYLLFGEKIAKSLNTISSFNTLTQIKNIVYGIGKDNLLKQNSSLWFLPALFCMSIFFYFFINFKDEKGNIIIKTFFLIAIGFVSSTFLKTCFPWGINTMLNVGFFYYIGYIFNETNLISKNNEYLAYIALLIIGFVAYIYNGTVMHIDYYYGNYWLMLISSLSFSTLFIKLSIIINKNNILEYIGKNTMGILIFHKIIIMIFQTKLGIISRLLLNSNIVIEILLTILVVIISIIVSLIIYNCLKKIVPFSFGLKREE